MSNDSIVRVWGYADTFEIEFYKGKDNRWYANVPPDIVDGQYAVGIYALNNVGEQTYWAGILYMHSGRACLHLNKQKYSLWLLPLCDLELQKQSISIYFKGVCS